VYDELEDSEGYANSSIAVPDENKDLEVGTTDEVDNETPTISKPILNISLTLEKDLGELGLDTTEDMDIYEGIKEAHEEFDPVVDSEAEMKLFGIAMSIVGSFFTAVGLLCQKIVNRNITKDPNLGPAMCHFLYLFGSFLILLGLGANTLMV
jgi:hypothetical protein